MLPITGGGVPPEGQDFNGIFYDITSHTVWVNAGGQYAFDATLAAAIGGYPVGIVLQNNAGTSSYVNVLANNATDFNSTPSSIGVSWIPYAGAALFQMGTTWCGTSTGSANAQILTPVPPLAAYVAGQTLSFIAGFTNSGALTVNVSGLGIRNVYKDGPAGPIPLAGGEVVAGNILTVKDDGTRFQLAATELGTAALANASSNTGTVSAFTGPSVIGHIAVFSDTLGTLIDGGAITAGPATVLNYLSNGATIGPGSYIIDTSVSSFAVTLLAGVGYGVNWSFADAAGSLSPNNMTINLGAYTFTTPKSSIVQVGPIVCNSVGLAFTLWNAGTTLKIY